MAIQIKVPEVGESITEVYVGEWHKAEGDHVAVDEDLVEIESDKATFDVPASADGTLTRILKQPGETAEVGEVIAEIETAQSTDSREAEPEKQSSQPPPATSEPDKAESDEAASPPRQGPPENGSASGHESRPAPLRRKPKKSRSRPPRAIEQDSDERRRVASTTESTARRREEEVIPMSLIRQRIARRLVEAQNSAALLTTFNEIDMSAVIGLRERFQDEFRDKHNVKLGFMSFFVKAAIDALQQLPQLNAEIRGTDIAYRNYYDIGIAIGSSRGLLVPVIRDADLLSFAEIESTIHDFAQRAEENELRLEELQGGTFTISNGGVYGSLLSTPIVNPPQSGVLGLHAIQDRPVVVSGEIVVRPMMYVALTYDHRIVDGREAVTFLRRIRETVEEPARMLIEA